MSYHDKYLKYKNKYLQLKLLSEQEQIGGDKPIIDNVDRINLFDDPQMEEYLNPIYGMIMSESGYINNNYFLHNENMILTTESTMIFKITRKVQKKIIPTLEIIQNINPIDFGRYVAIKYFNKDYNFIYQTKKSTKNYDIMRINPQKIYDKKNISADNEKIKDYVNKFRKIKTNDLLLYSNEQVHFHIILYCLWWVLNNDEGIIQYYNGINDVIDIINDYTDKKYELIDIYEEVNKNINNFEKVALEITKDKFKIFSFEHSNSFCSDKTKELAYSDCGEITARNFINLICIKNGFFNMDILKKYGAIQQLIEYYEKFSNFSIQADPSTSVYIFDQELNARDAWSKLIIYYANHNIKFHHDCVSHQYELSSGLSKDGKISNFLQLIKNLMLNIKNFNDFKTINGMIKDITNDINSNDGFGNIIIDHKYYGIATVYCGKGHYEMSIQDIVDSNQYIDYSKFNDKQIRLINILKKKLTMDDDYIYINFDNEKLLHLIQYISNKYDLFIKIFELSLTNQFDSHLRFQIVLNTSKKYFETIIDKYQKYKNINDYTFISQDLNFLNLMPNLTNLNFIMNSNSNNKIDLSLIKCIKSIGDNFLIDYDFLQEIDLSNPTNIQSIGNRFLVRNTNLKRVDLSGLISLQTIGHDFMQNCNNLQEINLSGLTNLQTIGNNFLYNCENLQKINLSGLTNLQTIGNNFLYNCKNLQEINLSGLTNLQTIGNNFLYNCKNLQKINLSGLTNLQTIGNNFLYNCKKLENANLSDLINLQTIGNDFMRNCHNLWKVDFPNLTKITSIGNNFLYECTDLSGINLSGLTNLQILGNYFMQNCYTLLGINLSNLTNLQTIGNNFMQNCDNLQKVSLSDSVNLKFIGNDFLINCNNLEEIDLSGLTNLESIGTHFLYGCGNLTSINLSGLINLKSIGTNFLDNCCSLTSINLSDLENLQTIDNKFMKDCYSLKNVYLSSLTNLTTIGNDFLRNCSTLKELDLSGLINLETVDKWFVQNCESLKIIKCTLKQKNIIFKSNDLNRFVKEVQYDIVN